MAMQPICTTRFDWPYFCAIPSAAAAAGSQNIFETHNFGRSVVARRMRMRFRAIAFKFKRILVPLAKKKIISSRRQPQNRLQSCAHKIDSRHLQRKLHESERERGRERVHFSLGECMRKRVHISIEHTAHTGSDFRLPLIVRNECENERRRGDRDRIPKKKKKRKKSLKFQVIKSGRK